MESRHSLAQTVFSGNNSLGYGGPSLLGTSDVQVDTTGSCPTPAFSIVGFAGDADNWGRGNERTINETIISANGSAYSGFGNYGVAAGITLPFGSPALKACNEIARSAARRRQSQRELEFLANCKNVQIQLSSEAINSLDERSFPEASKCVNVEFKEGNVQSEETAKLNKCFAWKDKGLDFEKIGDETLQLFPSLKPCMVLRFSPPTTRREINVSETRSPIPTIPEDDRSRNPDGFPQFVQINRN